MSRYHVDLPADTHLRHSLGWVIRVLAMTGTVAMCEKVRRDGTRDLRTQPWSTALPLDAWQVVGAIPRTRPKRRLR